MIILEIWCPFRADTEQQGWNTGAPHRKEGRKREGGRKSVGRREGGREKVETLPKSLDQEGFMETQIWANSTV